MPLLRSLPLLVLLAALAPGTGGADPLDPSDSASLSTRGYAATGKRAFALWTNSARILSQKSPPSTKKLLKKRRSSVRLMGMRYSA